MDYPTDLKTKNKGHSETTKLEIYDVTPFRSTFENVIFFSNDEQQLNFFETNTQFLHSIYKSNNFQFLPKTGEIFVEGTLQQFETATYLRFYNEQVKRWYYCFVYDVIYINENLVEIDYEVDVWQTFQTMVRQETAMLRGNVEYTNAFNILSRQDAITSTTGLGTQQRQLARMYDVSLPVEWLVIVCKPEAKIGNTTAGMTFAGTQKAFGYYIIPVNIKSYNTPKFTWNGQTYPSSNLKDIFSQLFGLGTKTSDKDAPDSVNNIVNMYYSRYIGIDYDFKKSPTSNTEDEVIIKTKVVGEIAQIGTRAQSGANPAGGVAAVDAGDEMTGSESDRVNTLAKTIKKYLPNAKPEGIAAIAGCFAAESSVTAKRYEADYATGYDYATMEQEPTAERLMGSWGAFAGLYSIGLNEAGYMAGGKHWLGVGLGQWTGPRCKALYDYCKGQGKSIFSFAGQIGFALSESQSANFKRIAESGGDVNALTADFLASWEGVPGNKLGERQAKANQYLPQIRTAIGG